MDLLLIRQTVAKTLQRLFRKTFWLAAFAGIASGLATHPALAGDREAGETGGYESKFYGTVDDLPQDIIGIWVVNGRQIVVTMETRIKEKHGRPEPGAYVEVEGSNTGAMFTASEISVKRSKQQQKKP